MTEALTNPPYVGLVPFNESDAAYFFGRDKDINVAATNLRANRLTIFYGASGVGKSSVIRAGVIPKLQKLTEDSAMNGERPDFLLVVVREWASNPIDGLRNSIKSVVEKALNDSAVPGLTKMAFDEIAAINKDVSDLSMLIGSWTKLVETKLLIIFDQFEDFFLHPEFSAGTDSFGEQFSKVFNNTALPVNFMISLRDDAVSKLDFFKGKINDPMKNTLRLRHLDQLQAKEAICKPVKKYNAINDTNFVVESGLIAQVLEDLQVGKIKFGSQPNAARIAGQVEPAEVEATEVKSEAPKPIELAVEAAQVKVDEAPNVDGCTDEQLKPGSSMATIDTPIEAPFLQLVMMKLWKDEVTQRQQLLTKASLLRLGGVKTIVETHLDEVMSRFNDSDKDLAAEFIHFTVSRSGAKITSDASGLADWAELPGRKDDIERILQALTSGETHIYKRVINLNDPATNYYQVSHDALAPAILNWRARYVDRQDKKKARIKILTRVSFVAALVLIIFASIFLKNYIAEAQRANAEAEKAKDALAAKNAATNTAKIIDSDAAFRAQRLEDETTVEDLETLVIALTDVSDKSQEKRDNALKLFHDLEAKGRIPDKIRPQLLALVEKLENGTNEEKRITAILKNPPVTPASTATPSQDSDANILPRVYIQISDSSLRPAANDIEKLLEANSRNFIVPGIEIVGNRKTPEVTQVRYFGENDKGDADAVVLVLSNQRIKSKSVYVSGYENSTLMRPRHLELWFADDAFDNAILPSAPSAK